MILAPILLYFMTRFSEASFSIALPFIRIDEGFGGDDGLSAYAAGLILSVGVAGKVCGKFFVAPLLDRLPPLVAMSVAAAGDGILTASLALARGPRGLGCALFVRTAFAAGTHPSVVRFLYCSLDNLNERARAFSMLGLASRAGSFSGTFAIAIFMQRGNLHWKTMIILVATFPVLAGAMTYVALGKHTKVGKQTSTALKLTSPRVENTLLNFIQIAARSHVFPCAVVMNVVCKLAQNCEPAAPLLFQDAFKISTARIGYFTCAYPLGSVFGNLILARWYECLPEKKRMSANIGFVVGSCLALGLIALVLFQVDPMSVDATNSALCAAVLLFFLGAFVAIPYYVEMSTFAMNWGYFMSNSQLTLAAGVLDGCGYGGVMAWSLVMVHLVDAVGWPSVFSVLSAIWTVGVPLMPIVLTFSAECNISRSKETSCRSSKSSSIIPEGRIASRNTNTPTGAEKEHVCGEEGDDSGDEFSRLL
jgi:hypothetical protein